MIEHKLCLNINNNISNTDSGEPGFLLFSVMKPVIHFFFQGGKAMSPNFLFCWPNAVIGLTEPQVVAQEIFAVSDLIFQCFFVDLML